MNIRSSSHRNGTENAEYPINTLASLVRPQTGLDQGCHQRPRQLRLGHNEQHTHMAKIIKKIPACKVFDLPVGNYKAALTQTKPMTKQTRRGPQDWVRLVFEVEIPGMEDQIPCAGRNFLLDLSPGADLRNFLEVWLGSDFFKANSNRDLDFDTLLNKDGDIVLSHYQGDEYDKPLVIVDNMFPAGSLKLKEQKPKSVAPSVKLFV